MKVRIKGTLVEVEFVCYTDVSQTIAVVQFKNGQHTKVRSDELSLITGEFIKKSSFEFLKQKVQPFFNRFFSTKTDIKVKVILSLIALYLTTVILFIWLQ